VPEENCNMVPMKVCNPVSRVVPSLEPVTQCIDTPKEICENIQINKRKEMRPVVKKWCGPDPNAVTKGISFFAVFFIDIHKSL
jgi:uncharacterized protein YcfJ